MNRFKASSIFSGGVIPLNNRRTLLKSYIWNYVVSNSGKATLENSIKGDIDLELIGGTEQPTTTGKNLFDESKAVTGRINPDNGELLPETSYISSDYIEVQEGETYFQSGSGDGYYRAFYDMNKKFTSIPTKGVFKITVPVGSKFLRISGRKERFGDWMIENGDKATPYEPYTGGKPSPSPEYQQEIKNVGKWNEETQKYEVDVKVTGKNLFDSRYASNPFNWVDSGDGFKTLNKPLITNGEEYTISSIKLLPKGLGFNFLISESFERLSVKHYYFYHNGNSSAIKDRVTVRGSDNLYLKMTGDFDSFASNLLNILQFEKGGNKTAYESYTEQALTLTSDRPLTKWDKLVEQDGQIGWLYGSKIYVVTGNEVFESRDGYNIEFYTNRFFILNDLLKENDALKPLAYMKCLRNVQYVYSPNIFEEGFETNINQFHIKLSNDRVGILTSDDHAVRTAKFSEYLKKIHKNGNPIEILYATTESQFVPLSESEQTQLRNLHSYNGTTHINIDSGEVPCGIKIAYKQKK